MILGTGDPSHNRSAFSLLEMLIVLGILALFAGFFALKFDDGRTEETLAEVSGALRVMVLKAKSRSSTFREDQYVILRKRSFESSDRPLLLSDSVGSDAIERINIPVGVTMEWLSPGQTKWNGEGNYQWHFRASGLSDPVSVRFLMGESFTRLDFGVLTGDAEEQTILK